LSPAVKLPKVRPAVDGVDQLDAFVPRVAELTRMRWTTVLGEIGGRGYADSYWIDIIAPAAVGRLAKAR
jgi:hypothetical protein